MCPPGAVAAPHCGLCHLLAVSGPGLMLPHQPALAFGTGSFNWVPLLLGYNLHERGLDDLDAEAPAGAVEAAFPSESRL